MLSFILKPIKGIMGDNIELPEIDPDTRLSISLIEAGCMFVLLNGHTTLLIKGEQEQIEAFEISDRISLDFELIERPEFPSIGAYVKIHDAEGRPTRFEYFFSLESAEETGLLEKLVEQDYMDIIFYTTDIQHVKRTTMNNEQKQELASLLTKSTEVV